jgi:hypothetical protein
VSVSVRIWSDVADDDIGGKERANKFVEKQLKEQVKDLRARLKDWASQFDCKPPCEKKVLGPTEEQPRVIMRPLPHDKVEYFGTFGIDVTVVCEPPVVAERRSRRRPQRG